jgi:hypothetical protein
VVVNGHGCLESGAGKAQLPAGHLLSHHQNRPSLHISILRTIEMRRDDETRRDKRRPETNYILRGRTDVLLETYYTSSDCPRTSKADCNDTTELATTLMRSIFTIEGFSYDSAATTN